MRELRDKELHIVGGGFLTGSGGAGGVFGTGGIGGGGGPGAILVIGRSGNETIVRDILQIILRATSGACRSFMERGHDQPCAN